MESRFLRALSEFRPASCATSRDTSEVEPAETWPVLVAVSGGVDSMTLLHLLTRLNASRSLGMQLHIAHLNHQLRQADSDADAEFVAAQAKEFRLPCTIETTVDVTARAKADGMSIELAARHCRYEFFERMCLKLNCHTVALAHHADDNVETILQRLIRGTGIRGLGGIRKNRPIREGSEIVLIRPMLSIRRAEIESYATNQNVPFRMDASNSSTAYTRNRVRHELLPLLREKFNPQVDEAVSRLAEQARELEAYLRETSNRVIESMIVEHRDRQMVLHGPSLARRPRTIQTQLIREVILRLGAGEGEITFGHLNSVADLLAKDEGAKEVHLPGGLRISRRYSRLIFELSTSEPIPPHFVAQDYSVSLEGVTRLPAFGLEIEAKTFPANEALITEHIRRRSSREQFCYEEWLDAERVKPPLIARSRRPGERFFPLGMTGMKKLSDFLIDEKIDADQREKLIILCDQLGPIWVTPLRIDERVRLTRLTRNVLRLTARPLADG